MQLVLLVWRAASGISRARAVEWLERASLLPLIILPMALSVPVASAGQHGGPAAHRWAYMPAATPAACQKIICSAPTHGDVHYLVPPVPQAARAQQRCAGPGPTAAQALSQLLGPSTDSRPGGRAQIERRPAPAPTAARTRRYRAQCRPLPQTQRVTA